MSSETNPAQPSSIDAITSAPTRFALPTSKPYAPRPALGVCTPEREPDQALLAMPLHDGVVAGFGVNRKCKLFTSILT